MRRVTPCPGMVIREDTVFEPGTYDFGGGAGIVIDGDDIMVDGNGAVLRAVARPPALPETGDHLYTPGDLGVSREEHELLMRKIEVGAGVLALEYRFWGLPGDPAAVSASGDGRAWTAASMTADAAGLDGWHAVRWDLGAWAGGRFQLRLAFPAPAVSPDAPCFYDAFRLLRDGQEAWRGDARENWQRWYATGFSVFKRASHGSYSGVAVSAVGRKGVRLRGLKARGFLTALSLKDCTGWTIEGNDFSGNYDDPEYGWGEGAEAHGAMHLENVTDTAVRGNRGRGIWNGIVLRGCARCTIEGNRFSHCSNACLKMARSCGNLVADNVLSWGIRIGPGEVHARDSVSLLVESGSDCNRFLRNDFSHGGDGIFIRVLNNWCCTGNLFEGNDCSHANNNAIEAWSPGNAYIRNRANDSSYGFWLGGSDDTVLVGNQALRNGREHANAPEPFGNAGVAVVHGSSTGTLLCGNRMGGNAGPGLSVAFTEESPARGWLVAGNAMRGNRDGAAGHRGHGVLLEYADGITLLGNRMAGNEGLQLAAGRAVRRVLHDDRACRAVLGMGMAMGPAPAAGSEATMSVARPGSAARVRFREFLWDFGDGEHASAREPSVRHVYARPGVYHACVTAIGRGAAGLATRMVCVLPRGERIPGCGDAAGWTLGPAAEAALTVDRGLSVLGGGCLLVSARRAGLCALRRRFPEALDLSRCAGISFFYRYACELFVHTGKRGRIIGVRLHSGEGHFEHMPAIPPLLERSEDRYAWVLFRAPRDAWRATGSPDPARIAELEILFGPEEPADLEFRLDAVTVEEGAPGSVPLPCTAHSPPRFA